MTTVGDALLQEVARRLGDCVTEHDTVARLGGDEFAVVQFCSDCDPSAVALLASHIVEKIGEPYDIGGHQLVVGVSIGISLAPEDGKNPDELLKKALRGVVSSTRTTARKSLSIWSAGLFQGGGQLAAGGRIEAGPSPTSTLSCRRLLGYCTASYLQ